MRLNLSLSLFLYTVPLPSIWYILSISLTIYFCFYKFLNLYLPDIKYISFFFLSSLLYFSVLSIILFSLSLCLFSFSAYRHDFILGFLVSEISMISLVYVLFDKVWSEVLYFWYVFSILVIPFSESIFC